jgi:YD repeat-containing protein
MTYRQTPDRNPRDDAGRILQARLASGEINETEYRERAQLLHETRPGRGTSSRRPLPWIVAAVSFVAIAALLVGSAGSGWSMMSEGMGMSGHMGRGGVGTSNAPLAGAPAVTVEAGDLWFSPAALEIQAGQPLNITLRNTGRVFHDFVVDELNFRLGAGAGDSVTGGLRLDRPGEYRFYCSVPGHASAGMTGTLTVVGARR